MIVRVPPGILTHTRIADLLGVTYPTIRAWEDRGYLPPPDFTIPDGRRLWLPGTIDRWLPTAGLTVCPDCGAQVRRVRMHQVSHRRGVAADPDETGRPGDEQDHADAAGSPGPGPGCGGGRERDRQN